jgi:hypothetical protein
MKTLFVRITFTESVLGTSPSDADVYRNFIGAKAPDAVTVEEEIEALGAEAVIEKGMTVFPRNDEGKPFIYDYQIKGFFKDACQMLKKVPGMKSGNLKAYKKEIDGLIFPCPREIVIQDAEIGTCQRPLRAQTALGERVALAMSEEIAAGAWAEFEVTTLKDDLVDTIREWMNYGDLRGIGQWRNSGKGRFTWEELEVR